MSQRSDSAVCLPCLLVTLVSRNLQFTSETKSSSDRIRNGVTPPMPSEDSDTFQTMQWPISRWCGGRRPGSTVRVDSLPHRKWREFQQQPGTAGPGNMLGCCVISFHFLWAILCPQAVIWRESALFLHQLSSKISVEIFGIKLLLS